MKTPSRINLNWRLIFTHFLSSVKPEDVQLLTNASANQACLGSYLNFNCSVGSANPPVIFYQLLKNDVVVDTSNSGMWIRMLPNSGVFTYKCVVNNTLGTANSTSVIITVGGRYYIPLIVLFFLSVCSFQNLCANLSLYIVYQKGFSSTLAET